MSGSELNTILLNKAKPVLRPFKGAILYREFFGYSPDGLKVTLPVGIMDEAGDLIHTAWLEPLTGRDEEWIIRVGRDLSLPESVSMLINRKTKWKGKFHAGDQAVNLSVTDRDILILYLRILTFGTEVRGITECPHSECDFKMDFSFDLKTLKVPAVKENTDVFSAWIDYRNEKINFSYREPIGADQEAISGLAGAKPYSALLVLLSRCLTSVDVFSEISSKTLGSLPQEVLQRMDKVIAEGMTSLDWDIELTCPECKAEFISFLDIQAFFWEELQSLEEDFWNEVHQLAFYYHWSEADILSLTRWKRKMFLSHIRRHLINLQ